MQIKNLFGIKEFGLSSIDLKPMVAAFTIVFDFSSSNTFLNYVKIGAIGTFVSFFMNSILLFT